METVTDRVFFSEAAQLSPSAPSSPPEIRDWNGTPVPDEVLAHPLLDEVAWIEFRDSGRDPLDESPTVTTYQSRVEFLVGAWIIDLIVPPRLGGSLLGNLQPQMLREADVLAAERLRNAILMPRRSSKTTSIWCVLLGRCWMRPLHMAGYTMLTLAKKAEERFELDVRDPIQRKWRDKRTRPLKLQDGKGDKGIEFHNGSKLSILAPKGEDVRSGAYDTLVMDEAGEAEPADWSDIIAAVVPSFDTRGDGAQLILAGTGGKYRIGSYFWATLHSDDAGRLRYGVPDDIDPALLDSWEAGAGRLIEQLHPGLDGLTTLDRIEKNFPDLGADRFAVEYLGHFGDEHGTSTAVSVGAWKRGQQVGDPPEGITSASLALAIHPHGNWSSIVVAWHVTPTGDLATAAWGLDGIDTDERHHIGIKLVHHQSGVQGIERSVLMIARQLRTAIVYDHGSSQSRAAVERLLARARPKPEVDPKHFADVKVAHAQFINGLEHGDIWHWPQAPLDKATTIAVAQSAGQGYLVRPPRDNPSGDVTPLEAAALALASLPARPTVGLTPGNVIDFG